MLEINSNVMPTQRVLGWVVLSRNARTRQMHSIENTDTNNQGILELNTIGDLREKRSWYHRNILQTWNRGEVVDDWSTLTAR
jgi:hypothetical protein